MKIKNNSKWALKGKEHRKQNNKQQQKLTKTIDSLLPDWSSNYIKWK